MTAPASWCSGTSTCTSSANGAPWPFSMTIAACSLDTVVPPHTRCDQHHLRFEGVLKRERFDLFDGDGIALVFLDMNIDTCTSQGRLLRNIMAAFAEYESDVKSDYARANDRMVARGVAAVPDPLRLAHRRARCADGAQKGRSTDAPVDAPGRHRGRRTNRVAMLLPSGCRGANEPSCQRPEAFRRI